jgi:hypothetical protein
MKRAAAFANGAARQRRHYPAFVALPLQQGFYSVNREFPTGSQTIANIVPCRTKSRRPIKHESDSSHILKKAHTLTTAAITSLPGLSASTRGFRVCVST